MCQKLIIICSGSAKSLVFSGTILNLLLALSLAYYAYTANLLHTDIGDLAATQAHLRAHHLSLGAGLYLALFAILGCLAVLFRQKQAARALAVMAAVNALVAVAAILMLPSQADLEASLRPRLTEAMTLYDFADKYPAIAPDAATNRTGADEPKARPARWVLEAQAAANGSQPAPQVPGASQPAPAKASEPLTKESATKLWDRLQERNCCGLTNHTDWKSTSLPKSCCSDPIVDGQGSRCAKVDPVHERGCMCVLEASVTRTQLVLALIALVNLYLCIVAGVNAYRTFHYDEASQNGYT